MAGLDNTATLLKELGGLNVKDIESDLGIKRHALQLANRLTAQLQEPQNFATELAFSPYAVMTARLAVDLELFTIVAASSEPLTPEELAAKSGAEPELVSRLLRLLSAVGFVSEVGEQLYGATPVTKAMANPALQSGYRFVWDILVNAAAKAPKYFRESHYRTGVEPHDGLTQYAHHTKLPFFSFLASMPSTMQDFNTFMGTTMGNRKYWVDWYPVQKSLLDGLKPDSALVVDIGGGKGHDLESFHRKYPDRGPLILQELPHVVEAAEATNPVFKCTVHDFFKEQPVKGARVYFLHHILHDWADKKCVEILERIKQAMEPGYSKILIHDLVLPNQNASAYQCIWDLTMMTANWGMERSERQWRVLLDKAGLQNVTFMVPDPDADSIIEVTV